MTWQVHFPMSSGMVHDDMRHLWTWLKWELEAEGMQDLPDEPSFDDPLEGEALPEHLLLVQYCGYPYLKNWQTKGVLKPLACYDYHAEGVADGWHCSHVIVSNTSDVVDVGQLKGRVAAINGYDSNSGMNLFRVLIAPHARGERFFENVIVTGSHAESMRAVAEGKADVAAIDALSFAYMHDHNPKLVASVRVLTQTQKSPVLPLFTPSDVDDSVRAKLLKALQKVISNEEYDSVIRDRLHIYGIRPVNDEKIEVIGEYEKQAEKLGYPELV